MSTIHKLKTWPRYFDAIAKQGKRFELRLNDRDFQPGDILYLREWYPASGSYTDWMIKVRITYVFSLKNYADIKGWQWALCRRLMPNLAILSIELIDDEPRYCPFESEG
jgi:hypothetical protein